jgi:chromate reductase, NAD(P)H dehydrogenase (quinone)
MASTINLVGMSGSLRKKSFNTAALRAAQSLLPEGVAMELLDIGGFPLYNDDVREQGYPEVVQHFRQKLADADGILIVTPEYNYSVSGVLKNAIDWGSRPPKQPFDGKPIAIMSASQGALGGARAQYHMRQMFVFLNGAVLNRPEVMISVAQTKFDDEGRLKDEPTREMVGKLVAALADAARKAKAGS